MQDTPRTEAEKRRIAIIVVIGAYILFSPFFVQVLKADIKPIRAWIMFRDVGIGILKGEFSATFADGSVARLSPLEVLDMPRYPLERQPYRFEKLVLTDADLVDFAAGYCSAKGADLISLSYKGRVGAGRSWRTLDTGDLCAENSNVQ